MLELKKVDALSAAKAYSFMVLPFLLLVILLNLVVILAGQSINLVEILMPLGQIVFAFIGTFIGAKAYNFIAGKYGGLKVKVMEKEVKSSEERKGKMIEIKKIDIKSIVKVYGILAAAISLIFGIFSLLVGLLANDVGLVGLGIVGPIIYIVFGVVFSTIIGLIYNLVAGKYGGIKVELEGEIEDEAIV